MQVTDEMVRVAARALAPELWADHDNMTPTERAVWEAGLTAKKFIAEEKAKVALTAALAAMWQTVTDDMEPNRNYLLGWRDWRDNTWCCEVAPAITGLRYENGYSSISHHGSATHYAHLPSAPSQLSKRDDAERDSIQEA